MSWRVLSWKISPSWLELAFFIPRVDQPCGDLTTSWVFGKTDLAHIPWRLRSKRYAISDLKSATKSLSAAQTSVKNMELHISSRNPGRWRVVLCYELDRDGLDHFDLVVDTKFFWIWHPPFPEFDSQVLHHTDRKILPFPSILQNHWSWIFPVCLQTDGLVVHSGMNCCRQHGHPHRVPCDHLHFFLELVPFSFLDQVGLNRHVESLAKEELHPCHGSCIGDRNTIELLLRHQIPDEKVSIVNERLKSFPPRFEPVRPRHRALGYGEPRALPPPLDLCLPDEAVESLVLQGEGSRSYMPPIVEPERSIDQDQVPEQENRSSPSDLLTCVGY